MDLSKPHLVSVRQADWKSEMSEWLANNVKAPLHVFLDIEVQDSIIVLGFKEEQDAIVFKLAFQHLY